MQFLNVTPPKAPTSIKVGDTFKHINNEGVHVVCHYINHGGNTYYMLVNLKDSNTACNPTMNINEIFGLSGKEWYEQVIITEPIRYKEI